MLLFGESWLCGQYHVDLMVALTLREGWGEGYTRFDVMGAVCSSRWCTGGVGNEGHAGDQPESRGEQVEINGTHKNDCFRMPQACVCKINIYIQLLPVKKGILAALSSVFGCCHLFSAESVGYRREKVSVLPSFCFHYVTPARCSLRRRILPEKSTAGVSVLLLAPDLFAITKRFLRGFTAKHTT